MSRNWRVIQKELPNILYGTGPLTNATARAVAEGLVPNTIFFSRGQRNCTTIGLHANADTYIDYDYCVKNGVDVNRGMYGYGALSFDKGSWLLVISAKQEDFRESEMAAVYREMLTVIAEALSKEYGIEVKYRPLNDLEINGKKVGGWGSYTLGDARTFYGFYQVKEPDMEFAAKVLKTPPEKIADKNIKSTTERMAYIEDFVGRELDFGEYNQVILKAFQEHFNMEAVPGDLSEQENRWAEEDWQSISNEDWIRANTDLRRLGPLPAGAKKLEAIKKISGGPALRVAAYVMDNRIINISITGSIHSDPRPMPFWIEGALKGVLLEEKTVRPKVEEVFSIGTVGMGSADDFVEAILSLK